MLRMLIAVSQPVWPEQRLINLLQGNVALAVPLVLLIIKLVVLRVAGDANELFRRLVSVPLDLVFISVGMILFALQKKHP